MPIFRSRESITGLMNRIGFHLIGWLIAYNILGIIVYLLIGDTYGYHLTDYVLWSSFAAIIIGILLGISEYFFDRIERFIPSFGKVILFKSILYILILSLMILFVGISRMLIYREADLPSYLLVFLNSPAFSTIFIFSVITSIILNFIVQVNRKFGQGELWAFILGKYFKPRVEKRIFMFLDLRSSTRYAEQLGHIKYSELIQKCFHYINRVVPDYKARLYQYVGDEVVLTWKWEDGLNRNRCIAFYFALTDLIRGKKDQFREKFGLVPQFKAGVHGGNITVAEVGDIKREIAYHGDVINTAARIQEKCNVFKRELLVSETIHESLRDLPWKSEKIGEVRLKGKEKSISVYAILHTSAP